MDPMIFFTTLTIIYLVLFFFDRFFKSCMHYPYDAFLKNTGITVDFMRLRWHTTAFNRAVVRWGNGSGSTCSRSLLTKSFAAGAAFAFLLLPVGVILLIITIFGAGHRSRSGGPVSESDVFRVQNVQVEIMLPGVNLPLEEVGFYVATLLFSTVIHELGHAMAAALEDVPVTGFGFQVYYCIPMAYTEISMEHLNTLKWFRKLRILCAGIWHNFLFALLCYLLLSSLGFVASPLYRLNENVIVTEVTARSPLRRGDRGLLVGNVVTDVNECRVRDEHTWYQCLLKALRRKPGFCVSSDFIRLNDESIELSHHGSDGVYQCCDDKNEKTCCFEYIDDLSNDAPVEIPQHACLDIRRTVEDAYDYCKADSCDEGFCMRPLLSNSTTILNFKRTSTDHKQLKDVIYLGHPADVTRTVRVSPFVPKYPKYVSPLLGDTYLLFLKYNIVFSIGLALVNAIPCFGFDGYHIISTIINRFLVNRVVERPKRDVISCIITCIGTLLFACAVLKVVWVSAIRHFF